MRFTDRVLEIPGRWLQTSGLDPERIRAQTGLLYQMVTGDIGGAGYFPLNAVRWMTEPREMAAWVREADLSRLEARLYHFGDQPRSFEAELYLLAPGQYEVRLEQRDGKILGTYPLQVEGRGARLPLTLPSRQECELIIERI